MAECFVYGDSLRDYNVALVVPSKDDLLRLAADKSGKSFEDLC